MKVFKIISEEDHLLRILLKKNTPITVWEDIGGLNNFHMIVLGHFKAIGKVKHLYKLMQDELLENYNFFS